MQDRAGKVRTSISNVLLWIPHIEIPVLTDQQGFACISSVRTLDAVKKSGKKWWMRGTNSKRERERGGERESQDTLGLDNYDDADADDDDDENSII